MRHLILGVAVMTMAACSAGGSRDVEAQNEAVVKQIYADFAAGDIDSFSAKLSPSIVWNEAENNPYSPDSPYEGIDSIMTGVMAPIGQDFSAFSVNPDSYIVDGDKVMMLGRYDATYKATGKTMTPQIVHIWTMKDGKAVAFQQIGDTYAMHAVVTP